MTKANTIKQLLQEGRTPEDVAKTVGCGFGYVYKIRRTLADPKGETEKSTAAQQRYRARHPEAKGDVQRIRDWNRQNPEKAAIARRRSKLRWKHRRQHHDATRAYEDAWLSLVETPPDAVES